MHILHVSDVFLRHGGGAPNVIFQVAQEQIKAGHKVSVATFAQDDDWPEEEEISGVKVFRTPLKKGIIPFYFSGFINMYRMIKNKFAANPPDVIHLHMPFAGLAVHWALSKVPVVYTFHGSWTEEYAVEASGFKRKTGLYLLELWFMREIEKRALAAAGKIFTLSKFMQERAKKIIDKPADRWQIVPSGVDLERFTPLTDAKRKKFRQDKNIPADSFFIFCTRRLARRMGLAELIRSISKVKQDIPSVYLVVGGKGELHGELMDLIEKNNLAEHVKLAGFIPEEELAGYFASADLFVLPTQDLEGFGLIILESMAAGTPIIGTPVGSIPEVIGGFSRDFLINGKDASAIAQAVIAFNENFSDANELRNRVRTHAEQFSWQKMAESYLQEIATL